MKLDTELLKKILIWCEDNIPDENKSFQASEVQFEGYTPFQTMFHIKKLVESGYILAYDSSTGRYTEYIFEELSLEGYELLNIMKNDTVGAKIKKVLSDLGLQAFPILLTTAIKAIGGVN